MALDKKLTEGMEKVFTNQENLSKKIETLEKKINSKE